MNEPRDSIGPGSYIFGSQGGYVGVVDGIGEGILRVRGPSPDSRVYHIPAAAVVGRLAGREFVLDCPIEELQSRGWLLPSYEAPGPIMPGGHVYGSRGGYVGVVEAASGDLLRVRGPGPESLVYYVPTEAVAGQLGDGREIVLNYPTEELRSKGWLHPPRGFDRS